MHLVKHFQSSNVSAASVFRELHGILQILSLVDPVHNIFIHSKITTYHKNIFLEQAHG